MFVTLYNTIIITVLSHRTTFTSSTTALWLIPTSWPKGESKFR